MSCDGWFESSCFLPSSGMHSQICTEGHDQMYCRNGHQINIMLKSPNKSIIDSDNNNDWILLFYAFFKCEGSFDLTFAWGYEAQVWSGFHFISTWMVSEERVNLWGKWFNKGHVINLMWPFTGVSTFVNFRALDPDERLWIVSFSADQIPAREQQRERLQFATSQNQHFNGGDKNCILGLSSISPCGF